MVGARFLDLSRFDRCAGEGRSDMAWRGAVRVGRSGDGPASQRRQRGAGVVEALEASTSGARQPCGPAGRPTAKDGGETGKSVCGPRPGTPVDAEVDLDVIWMPGGLLVTDRLERGFL